MASRIITTRIITTGHNVFCRKLYPTANYHLHRIDCMYRRSICLLHYGCHSFSSTSTNSSITSQHSHMSLITSDNIVRYSSSLNDPKVPTPNEKTKLTLFQKFKQMYKEYWYVLLPVHCATSVVWFGGFYYMALQGVDIVPLLEYIGAGETIISPLRDSKAGYLAVAYAFYKLATPARYAVTVGGTTISINYLKNLGYIKPVPTKEQLKKMYEEQKENLMEKYEERKENLMEKYEERKENLIEKIEERKENLREKIEERKENLREKIEEQKENLIDKYEVQKETFKEKFEEQKESLKGKYQDSLSSISKKGKNKKGNSEEGEKA